MVKRKAASQQVDGLDWINQLSPKSLVSNYRLPWEMPELIRVVKIPSMHYDIAEKLLNISSHHRVEFVGPAIMFCSDGVCKTTFDSGKAIYKDSNHFTASFVRENALFVDSLITSD